MQGIKSGFCKNNDAVKEGYTITLDDVRDHNEYTVVKLRDGNCWMQQNLRLAKDVDMQLKADDTDLPSGVSTWTLPAAVEDWNVTDYTVAQTRIGNTSQSANWQISWGNYYSWCAATAGTCSSATAQYANATGSICPKGWKLPTGGQADSSNQFYVLFGASGSVLGSDINTKLRKVQATPYAFPAAGALYNEAIKPSDAGTYGHYWSRTTDTNLSAYRLWFGNNGFTPATSPCRRWYGNTVRCVAEY